jgi:ubiquinone biosynthesis protein Coq4
MQLFNSVTSHASVNVLMQKQMHNPILKGFQSVLTKLLIAKSFSSMLLGDNSLETVGELTYGLLETPAYERLAQHLNQDPACAALIRDRYIPPVHDLDALLTLPHDSLGYIYATQMKKTGFNPNLHAGMTAKSDAEYVELRLSQTHDLWHIITGFGPSGLQAFHLPQFPYPLATMLIANSLISTTLREPELLPQFLQAIAQGFQMGKIARPLFAQKWEEGWEKPLTQWQAELNIEPITNA